jgi:hypothetical protein
MVGDVLIFITLCATVFGCIFLIINSRHRQRMALIEKGMDASLLVTPKAPRKDLNLALMFGMLMVGLGVGILLGYILNHAMPEQPTEHDPYPDENPAFYFLSILICGGVALIAHHFIVRNKRQG